MRNADGGTAPSKRCKHAGKTLMTYNRLAYHIAGLNADFTAHRIW